MDRDHAAGDLPHPDDLGEKPFGEYVIEDVMTKGGYEVADDEPLVLSVDVEIAEYGDGSGFVMPEDVRSLVEDDGVELKGIALIDGGIRLKDRR